MVSIKLGASSSASTSYWEYGRCCGSTATVSLQRLPFSGNIPGQKFRQMAVGLKPHFFQNLHRHETFYRFTLLKNLTQRRKERN
jgi:hypothetical protein